MVERIECAVIGAGVIGLAIARALATAGREVVIIERNPWIGNETSSRNNEVIHAGFLYPPQSLRGHLCRPGAQALISYCLGRDIELNQCGKLVLALGDDEAVILESMMEIGAACSVKGLEWLSSESVRQREPDIVCVAAIHSPETAVVDSHAFMLALQGDAEEAGAVVAFSSEVTGGTVDDGTHIIEVASGDGVAMDLRCDVLVNAAGLGAELVARRLLGLPAAHVPKIHYSKGHFMSYAGAVPFQHIVVPLGETLMAGGALTRDIAGRAKFGPDQKWVDKINYDVPEGLTPQFADAVGRYWRDVDGRAFSPDYAGIRPRCWGAGKPPGDWIIEGPPDHGVPGLVNLFGIETPGVTAALSIADYVTALLDNV